MIRTYSAQDSQNNVILKQMCFGIRTTPGSITKAEKYIHKLCTQYQGIPKLSVKAQVKTITLRTIKSSMSQDESYAAGLYKPSRGRLEGRRL